MAFDFNILFFSFLLFRKGHFKTSYIDFFYLSHKFLSPLDSAYKRMPMLRLKRKLEKITLSKTGSLMHS